MKLTIVLTVYNKEKFLRRALDSLLSQKGVGKEDYEILVINDGSTDLSPIIIDDYARRYNNIRIHSQNNQGLSRARNNGIDLARGEYIWFVDADDYIVSNAVSNICELLMLKPDVIPIYAKTEGIDKIRNAIDKSMKSGKEILIGNKWEPCSVFYILKRSFLLYYNLRFVPSIFHEDSEFTPRMLYLAKNTIVIPYVMYVVVRDPNGITFVPRPKRAYDYLIVAEKVSAFVLDKGETKSKIGHVLFNHASRCINTALFIISHSSTEHQKDFNNFFYEKRTTLLYPLKNADLIKYRSEAFLFNLLPNKYVAIYKTIKFIK